MAIELAREGFRAAPTVNERTLEAVNLFRQGRTGMDFERQAALMEAFTTDDFPALLARGFTLQAMQLAQNITNEFEPLLADMVVNDFEDTKLVDMWSEDEFEEVAEGEEYKGGTVKTVSRMFHRARKYGKNYGLTFELRKKRAFFDLANFPRFLANGAVRGQCSAVANELLNNSGAWDGNFFEDVEDVELSRESLKAALKTVRERKNHRGQRVGGDNMVLLHGQGLTDRVDEILNPINEEVRRTNEETGETIVTTQNNPLSGRISQRIESDTLSDKLGNPNGWALLKAGNSDLPSLIRTMIDGLQGLDIRVQKDQGQYVAGGDVPIDEGSFKDDTIWFRGRDIWGIDPGFKIGTYASNGGSGN